MTYFQPHPTRSLISIVQRTFSSSASCDTNHKTIALNPWNACICPPCSVHLPLMLHAFAQNSNHHCFVNVGFLCFPNLQVLIVASVILWGDPDFVMVTLNPKSQNQGKCVITSLFTRKVEIVYSLVFFSLYGVLGLAAHFSCSSCATKCLKVLKFQIGLTRSVGGGGPWPITTSTTHTQN
jgi:hypothetical protein